MKKVYTVLLIMVITSAVDIAASPQLDVRIAQNAITASSGNLVSVQITYENVGDSDLQLYLFVYDDGSNETSPRPTFTYEGGTYSTAIDTGVIFGVLTLPLNEFQTIEIVFDIGPAVIPGEYVLHIGGYQEKVEDSYIGYDDDILVLTVLPAVLSAPVLVSPAHAEVDAVPGLVWTPVQGARGYTWEIATSNTVDETGLFTDVVCSGSTTTESAVITCDLQKDIKIKQITRYDNPQKTGDLEQEHGIKVKGPSGQFLLDTPLGIDGYKQTDGRHND